MQKNNNIALKLGVSWPGLSSSDVPADSGCRRPSDSTLVNPYSKESYTKHNK